MYPYWCIEKGYARYTGPARRLGGVAAAGPRLDPRDALDIACSLIIYTSPRSPSTCSARASCTAGLVPQANATRQVSRIYTDTLGEWAIWLFYPGAVLIALRNLRVDRGARALSADLMRVIGAFPRADTAAAALARIFPSCSRRRRRVLLAFASPVKMVVAGGLAQR